MEKNKKICICFFGLIRHSKGIKSIEKNVFEVFDKMGYPYDVFVHTYDLEKTVNHPRSKENGDKLDHTLYKKLNPKKELISSQEDFDKTINMNDYSKHGDAWNNGFVSTMCLLRQLNSLKLVTGLWKENKDNYYAVLYLRPDLVYITPPDLSFIDFLKKVKNGEDKIIGTPCWHKSGGLNDRIAYGTPDAMIRYGERFDDAKGYASKTKLHSESLVKYIVSKYNMQNKDLKVKASRVRANGYINPENFNA